MFLCSKVSSSHTNGYSSSNSKRELARLLEADLELREVESLRVAEALEEERARGSARQPTPLTGLAHLARLDQPNRAMYVMYMRRKQLYIEERHERELKLRAKALGVTEAEVVRQALDAMLEGDGKRAVVPGRHRDLDELLERATKFSKAHRSGASRYRREELYDERENRWARP